MIRVLEARFFITATKPSQYPRPEWPEIAFVGRSNVGKSSMINTLTNRRKLVRVSNTPGRTRTLNFFDVDLEIDKRVRTLRLCDLPGYGYAKASKTDRDDWQEMISSYIEKRQVLKTIVTIVDAEVGPMDSDRQMISYLVDKGPRILVAATKIDRIAKSHRGGKLAAVSQGLGVPPEAVVAFSSTDKIGVDTVWDRLVGATVKA